MSLYAFGGLDDKTRAKIIELLAYIHTDLEPAAANLARFFHQTGYPADLPAVKRDAQLLEAHAALVAMEAATILREIKERME